jgi:hypothetical protein
MNKNHKMDKGEEDMERLLEDTRMKLQKDIEPWELLKNEKVEWMEKEEFEKYREKTKFNFELCFKSLKNEKLMGDIPNIFSKTLKICYLKKLPDHWGGEHDRCI